MDLLVWLQEWYRSQCNGDWEHSEGVDIGTVDNPGWSVSISLEDTTASRAAMAPFQQDQGDDDWIFCKVENGKFKGHGDPGKLTVILQQFRELVARYDPYAVLEDPNGPSTLARVRREWWRRAETTVDDINLLPAELRAKSLNDREIVLSFPDALQAIDRLEAARWAMLGWEGWLHYAGGGNGLASQFQGIIIEREPVEAWERLVHRSAAACRSTIEEARQRWTIQPERRDADLFFCLTAADQAWFEEHSRRSDPA